MFTGLVQSIGVIQSTHPSAAGRRIVVALDHQHAAQIKPGDSIAVAGVCLTVYGINPEGIVSFDVVQETLNRTTLGEKLVQEEVNIELSLRAGDPIGGHFVQGHVDATARVLAVQSDPADWRIICSLPGSCQGLIVEKGSVTIDGVSMTVAQAGADDFSVAVIPTTLEQTTLGELKAGQKVNIETDILTRTIVNYLKRMELPQRSAAFMPAGHADE
jgi:riboflavin synthase